MDQSKQGHGKGKEGKRKADDEAGRRQQRFQRPRRLSRRARRASAGRRRSREAVRREGHRRVEEVVAAAPAAWAPKRELARVYKKAERWNAVHRGHEGRRRQGELASPEDKIPRAVRDDRGLSRSAEARRHGRQRLQPDPEHPADQRAGGRGAGGAVRGDEALARSDLAAAQQGGRVAETPEKVALHLKVANLFLEKFSNQAEAIKSFEAILELDPEQPGGARLPEADVREAPRLGEARRRSPARDRACPTRTTQQRRRIEVAKLASEKLKKPAISIDLWKQVLAERPREHGGARRAREALRAREGLGRARRRAAAAGRGASDAAQALGAAGQAGHPVHGEGRRTAPRPPARGSRCCARAGQPARAGRAQEALPRSRRTGTRSRCSTRPRTSGTSSCACSSGRPRPEDDRQRRPWNKIGELYRDKLDKADRAQKAFEKALSLDAQNLVAAEALIPLYEKGKDVRRARRHAHGPARRTPTEHATTPRAHPAAHRSCSRRTRATRPNALRITLQAFSEDPTDEWAQDDVARLAGESGTGPSSSRPTRRRCPKVSDEPRRCR